MSHKRSFTPLTLGNLIEWTGGVSEIAQSKRNRQIRAVWNDSREISPGDVFVAIATEKDDGHRYVDAAFEAGAIAAIVAKRKVTMFDTKKRRNLIQVPDPLKALQRAAHAYRKKMGILFVGITGSNGKTTTRNFIAEVLRQGMPIGETYSNWNNHIGVPLSILRFIGDEWAGVIEMGANHQREIHTLSRIVKPDIGIVTNIGYAHIGLFGSLANTTTAKFEIADGIPKDGFLLLNGDDNRLFKGAREQKTKAIFYGFSSRCTIRATSVETTPDGGSMFMVDDVRYKLSMPGRHFIYSALPAIFIGRRCRIPDKEIAKALVRLKPLPLRGTIERKKKATFIVDCYNANPSSMHNALEYLTELEKSPHRVVVVGDMLELGSHSHRLHRQLGQTIARMNIRSTVAIGKYARYIAEGMEQAGKKRKIKVATDAEQALPIVRSVVREGDTVLLKGSRGVRLEKIFKHF
jgi:UDP-N-acetylmuramoyl-tripeptide--D-alanyl-D-alanine ligase